MTKLQNPTGVLTPTGTNVVLLQSQQGVVLVFPAAGKLPERMQEIHC